MIGRITIGQCIWHLLKAIILIWSIEQYNMTMATVVHREYLHSKYAHCVLRRNIDANIRVYTEADRARHWWASIRKLWMFIREAFGIRIELGINHGKLQATGIWNCFVDDKWPRQSSAHRSLAAQPSIYLTVSKHWAPNEHKCIPWKQQSFDIRRQKVPCTRWRSIHSSFCQRART